MTNDTIYRLLRADGSITTNKHLIFSIGLNEAIIFSELLSRYYYFEGKEHLQEDSSFFNTVDDLYLGTGIAERAQRTAINNLKKLNLIAVENKGVPPKRYFRINTDMDLIETYLSKGKEIMDFKKLELQAKSILNLSKSPFTAFAVIKEHPTQELKTAEGMRNNTKLNYTKNNKKRGTRPPTNAFKEVIGKKIKYAVNVSMTEIEYNKAIETHSKTIVDNMIIDLNNWKGSTGKTKKSDFYTILAWIIREDKTKIKPKKQKVFEPY